MPRLFVHASNVHQGGGAVLLSDLLRAIPPNVETIVHVDARMGVPADLPDHIYVERFEPTLRGRFAAERRLAGTVAPNDRVLCFGNLPPLFSLKCKVFVYLQNRYLVGPIRLIKILPLKIIMRVIFERAWLVLCKNNADLYMVQTLSMNKLTQKFIKKPAVCAAFSPVFKSSKIKIIHEKKMFDFIYVASGESHKNHEKLIDAWCLLAQDGLFPSLALTLSNDQNSKLLMRINKDIASSGIRIINIGNVRHDQMVSIYEDSSALIYPSLFESFGLPLIEARQAGLVILASELDYVRDVVEPDLTFDPSSALSIARAVKRFFLNTSNSNNILTSKQFLENYVFNN